MPKKRYSPEEIVSRLRQVDVLVGEGKPVGEAVKAIGVTETTYHRWRREYGGLKLDQVKRLKELEAEHSRMRRAVVVAAATCPASRGAACVTQALCRRDDSAGARPRPRANQDWSALGITMDGPSDARGL